MRLLRYRIFNLRRIIAGVTALISMWIYWFFYSGVYDETIGYNINSLEGARTLSAGSGLLKQILTFGRYMDIQGCATTILYLILIFLVTLFYNEKCGLSSFRYVRGEKQSKVILSTIFSHSIINAIVFYVIYVIYTTIGYMLLGNTGLDIPRNIFDGIFGVQFSQKNPYLYYLIQGIPSFFIGTFAYTWMGCCISLVCKRAYQMIICMFSYFWGVQVILEFIRCTFMSQNMAMMTLNFTPAYLYGFYGYVYPSPTVFTAFQMLLSLILPVLISIIILYIFLRGKEKINV